jgi:hypothetical protein
MQYRKLNPVLLFKQAVTKFSITALFMLIVCVAQSQVLSVIANQKGSPTNLSWNELKSVFMGEKLRWGNGTKIVVALLKTNNPLGIAVCKRIYDMDPDELNKYWLGLVFQGKVSAPFFFNSVSELQNFISQNPGSIGIIDQSVNIANVKTLVVDGRKTL